MDDDEDPFTLAGLDSSYAPALEATPPPSNKSLKSSAKNNKEPSSLSSSSAAKRRELDEANAVLCGVCGKANAADFRFCRSCGSEAEDASTTSNASSSVASVPDVLRRGGAGPVASSPATNRAKTSAASTTTSPPVELRRTGTVTAGRGRAMPEKRTSDNTAAADDANGKTTREEPPKSPREELAKGPRATMSGGTNASTSSLPAAAVSSPAAQNKPTRPVPPPTGKALTVQAAPLTNSSANTGSGSSAGPPSGDNSGSSLGSRSPPPERATLLGSGNRLKSSRVSQTNSTMEDAEWSSSGISSNDRSSKRGTAVLSGGSSSNNNNNNNNSGASSPSPSNYNVVLIGRPADDETRMFLDRVVKEHEEAVRQELAENAQAAERRRVRAPTVKLKGTWSKTTKKVNDGSIIGWSTAGIESMSEGDGGNLPPIVFYCTQYFADKKCYNYSGLFKTQGSVPVVNRIMESFADRSFKSFDAFEATPLDVASALKSFLLILPESVIPHEIFLELFDPLFDSPSEKRDSDVRNLLMRVNAVPRQTLRVVLDWARRIVAAQPLALKLDDAARFFSVALARTLDQSTEESESYAVTLALLQMNDNAFESAPPPAALAPAATKGRLGRTSSVSSAVSPSDETAFLKEELDKANQKAASLQRQLDEARKSVASLKRKVDTQSKEISELKRKNQEQAKVIEGWKAKSMLDMF